ncbi:growth/differentiation factor 9 isoform X2 [Sorex fumeus]|uniref:growth/differentiation factor 9 isoform X2 n=1 Tax=Sorex fumeus TaxID=62283 RepID=UPI0024ACEA9D|nr:growth/differentiation factor 9 isoform X2 [Sorex fumeus]
MALPHRFLWFGCVAWLCFPIILGSRASRVEAQIANSAELESGAAPWSLLQPLDGRERPGLLPPLFKVLYDEQGGTPRLQPDSRALRYMKRLYKAYATKEGIPKSNRSHLYNTVRLFTPCAQHKQSPGDQVTGSLSSVDLLFNLDRLEFQKKHKWLEMDVTSLLQPFVASNKRSILMAVNLTCMKEQPQSSAQDGTWNLPLLVRPSLLLYLNDTSTQAYHRWYSVHSQRRPAQCRHHKRGLPAHHRMEPAVVSRSSRARRDQKTGSSELKKPLVPTSLNLSEYFKQFLFPQNECELHDFRLSFSQLKWDNWIVAPHRYNPRYCKGDCPRAVGHRYGSPVHTMVQNIIYEKLDSSVPKPSCVPAKYSPLSVLTIEPDGSIAYKEYEDMIATKCTCR